MSSDNVDRVVPPVVIVLRLPAPFDPVEITFSASEIAKPTIESDPTTTIFDREWQMTIFRKTIQTIESTLAQHSTLTDNEHFTNLQEVLEYPYISQHKFDWYFQFSVQYISFFMEINHSQVLQLFSKLYSRKYPNSALVLHLKLEGAACRHLRNAFSFKPRTTLVDCKVPHQSLSPFNTSAPIFSLGNRSESSSADYPQVTRRISTSPNDHLALSDFHPPVNLVTDSAHFSCLDGPSLSSTTTGMVPPQSQSFESASILHPDNTKIAIIPIPTTTLSPTNIPEVLHPLSIVSRRHVAPGFEELRDFTDMPCNDTTLFQGQASKISASHYFTESISRWFTLRRRPPDLHDFLSFYFFFL
jgi:hypothetical protein